MITSMTGFGRGEASEGGITVTVELRSVNSRYLDISLRLPQVIQDKELELKELINGYINRGKLNVSIRIDQAETGEPEVTFNEKLVKGYKTLLEEINEAAGIREPVSLQDLLQFNEIFVSREQDEQMLNRVWQLSKEATQRALEQLLIMRRQEGSQLKEDLLDRVDHINQVLKRVKELTEGRAAELRDKLLERIQSLVDDDAMDADRLELEVAILVDKMDITEEIVRLQSHIKFFKEALEHNEAVGRRLNFLSQEMNREINTIGSKANNSEISQYVVQAKESLEQIREQVQNVE
jgi:uncharacterized protein (TIGR00255 family)